MDFQSTPPPVLEPVAETPGKPGRMSGSVPKGWRDDSSWAEVTGEYVPEEFEGTRYLRVRVDRLDGGAVQLAAPFSEAKTGTAYEINLNVRAPKAFTFTVQVRQAGPPYKEYWRGEARAASAQFEEIKLETSLLPKMENPMLIIQFGQVGTVDIRSLAVVPATLGSEPDTTSRNLLRMSRFPLGPQDGLSLYREVSDETVTFAGDPTVWGPSGVPALHVSSGDHKKFHFDGELIAGLRRGQPHTATVWIKGDGTLILSALSSREGGSKTEKERFFRIRPEHGWQRAELSFTSAKDTPNQFLRFTVNGDIWMDSFMVAPGDEAPVFAGQGAAEVALALPEGPATLAGIQFADEAARLRWAVSGELENGTLRVRVTSATGAESELAPIPLAAGFYQTGELDFGVIEGQPLGAFRVNAAVFDAGEKQISPWSERVVLRVEKPRFWGQTAPQSAFGQHLRPALRHILMAKALGNNWARLHNDGAHITDWASIEPKPGDWRWSDADLQRYADGHLAVLGQFSTAPKWASYLQDTGVEGSGGYFGKYFLPKDLGQFRNYVTTLASRYQNKIQAYEVWNEPWQVKWFGVKYVEEDGRRRIVSPPDAQKRYVELCQIAFEAAKAVDSNITIIGLNSTSTIQSQPGPDGVVDGKTWSAGVIEAGGLKWSDAVSFHTYSADANGFPGDSATAAVETAVGTNDLFPRIDQPVWMTEGSSTVGGRLRFGLNKHTLPYRNPEDVAALAEGVLRYDLSMLANGVEKIFLYSMGDFEQGSSGTFRSGVTLDGAAHPASIGRATLAWHVDGLKFMRHEEIAPGVHAFFFEGEGRSVAVLAPRPDHSPYSLPEDPALEVRDLWNNPLAVGSALEQSAVLITAKDSADALEKILSGPR